MLQSKLINGIDCIYNSIETLLDTLPGSMVVDSPCTSDMTCQRIGKRHKNGCIGRTPSFTAYVRELRSL